MKIVINECFGGFSLSDEACIECIKRGMTVSNILTEPDKDADFSYHPPKEDYPPEQQKEVIDFLKIRYYIGDRDQTQFRMSPIVISVIEEMGETANGECAQLKIVDLPDGIGPEDIIISEYDGQEWVAEKHRTWG